MKKGIKTVLIIVGILIVAIVLYSAFFNNPDSGNQSGLVSGTTAQPVAGVQSQNAVSGVQIGQEFISLLLSLQQLNLDTTLFQDRAFQSLQDKTIQFQDPGGQGRPNPFAPIGSGVITAPAPTPTESGDTALPPDSTPTDIDA